MKHPYCLLIVLCFFNCESSQDKTVNTAIQTPRTSPCDGLKDTTTLLQVNPDSSFSDFAPMITFIESKGNLRQKGNVSKPGKTIYLHKARCEATTVSETPHAHWKIDNLYNISCKVKAGKAIRGTAYYPSLTISQLNFNTAEDADSIYQMIREIGWGTPDKKNNYYQIVKAPRRIYIVECQAHIFRETMNRYAGLLQKGWVAAHIQ